ncbi:DNA-binding NarL/FixJ family response regulator [Acholeplasma morum]|uniref:sigma factor-like helix-turn-helix DNA-binding protein n=1 Tax=Paracholeplasma morum TaxID=264637 RepID=UPI001955FF0A|nr:sigma factor-like helix-turn-helix DNA-binding protein [Paracholeplasma morum]MBM7453820.1 DNA-binding NarL/FixJ family response regulator [Paracholeplasma morum]
MNVKEYLSRYQETKDKIEKLEQIVAEYIRLANTIPGINFDQVRIDGTKSLQAPFEKWILRALDDEILIESLKKDLPKIKCEILASIDCLDVEEERKLLIFRYIDCLSWKDIAEKLFVSSSTLKRWHSDALSKIIILDHDGPS